MTSTSWTSIPWIWNSVARSDSTALLPSLSFSEYAQRSSVIGILLSQPWVLVLRTFSSSANPHLFRKWICSGKSHVDGHYRLDANELDTSISLCSVIRGLHSHSESFERLQPSAWDPTTTEFRGGQSLAPSWAAAASRTRHILLDTDNVFKIILCPSGITVSIPWPYPLHCAVTARLGK